MLANLIYSLAHDAKGTPLSLSKYSLPRFSGHMTVHSVFCFKLSFTRLFGVLFTFPSQYSSLSVICSYLGSRMVPLHVLLTKGVLFSFLFLLQNKNLFSLYRTITFFGKLFQTFLIYIVFLPNSLSFATTYKISFDFFSFCYWDVSLHKVLFFYGFPQEIHRSQSFSLPMTFRKFTSS